MGATLSSDALELFVADLAHLSDDQIKRGLERVRREVKGSNGFAPRLILQDVLDRAGAITQGEAEDFEAIAAWDMAVMLATKFAKYREDGEMELRRLVGKPDAGCAKCEGKGMYPQRREGYSCAVMCGCRTIEQVPHLSDRLADVVKRMGGWQTFRDIKASSYPFVRRDFMATFAQWGKIERYADNLPSGESVRRIELRPANNFGPSHLESVLDQVLAAPLK